MAPLHPLFDRSANESTSGVVTTRDIHPEPLTRKTATAAIIVTIIAIIMIVGVIMLSKGTLANKYDWIRRGFRDAPPVHKETPYVFFNARLNEEAERKRREEEEANKSYVQRHLEALRAWRKPAAHPDPETGLKIVVPKLSVPEPVARPGFFVSTFSKLMPSKTTGTATEDATLSKMPKHSEAAERRIQALKDRLNGRAMPAAAQAENQSYPTRGPMQQGGRR